MIAAVTAERDEARGVLSWQMHETWDGSGLDGFDLQDELERRGLLVSVPATKAEHDEHDTDVMFVFAWSERGRASAEVVAAIAAKAAE